MARARLKKVADQVVVITGASSGIGLVTAREAARRGARVVLVARNEAALQRAVADIEASGGVATYVTGDVASPDDMERVAQAAIESFGGFDTWVNNASTSIYARLDEVHLDDKRRLFDVVYWGVVHGCRAALPHLKQHGGAIVNIGSVASDLAIPLLGAYSAAKHAVKAYTDALRIELEADGSPVSVSLVKPASIDTPFFAHSRNYMDVEPKPVPPVYAPDLVADTILHCAEQGARELNVGGAGRAMALMKDASPAMMDRYMAGAGIASQRSDRPARAGNDNLFDYAEDGRERGGYQGSVRERSFYSVAQRNPWTVLLAAVGMGAAFAIGRGAARRRAAGVEAADDTERFHAMDVGVAADATARAQPLRTTGGERVVQGDTSVTDLLVRGELEPAATPRARENTRAGGSAAAMLADVGRSSTEDGPASLRDATLLDASLDDAARADRIPPVRQNTARPKADEDWLIQG